MSLQEDRADRETGEPLLDVRNLSTVYETGENEPVVRAVEDVSFAVESGETFGLVGESGCGKTTLGLSIIRALPPQGKITGGEMHLEGENVASLSRTEVKRIQWDRISMIYQGALNAFNPVMTIGEQIEEALELHDVVPPGEREARVATLLEKVNLRPEIADQYPHELSGGMKQRAAIAMAVSCDPDLLIADEPTTALDVVVQAEVLQMLTDLQDELDFGMIVISHDLAVIMKLADRIGVMYAGKLVEVADSLALYREPSHPYTVKLMNSVIDPKRPPDSVDSIPGTPPDLRTPANECRFAPRCSFDTEECWDAHPELESVGSDGHQVACYHTREVRGE